MELADRTVLITGAARGIGAETARVLAARGARVSLVGLEPEELAGVAAELGDRAAWFKADVTDPASLEAAVAGTVARFGGVDVVMANAGIASMGTVTTIDPGAFARTVDVNLTGVFHTVRLALPHVIARKGYVLVIASVAAFVPGGGMSAYAASKAGAEAFATAMHIEMGPYGVAVGCAHPSWIDTDMVRDAEHDLESFKRFRAMLPWPLHATTTVHACAELLANGIERRKRRIFVPRSSAVPYWLRAVTNSPAGVAVLRKGGTKLIPQMEAEVVALGRSLSERAQALQQPEPEAELPPAERSTVA